jgi:hypothetical protein
MMGACLESGSSCARSLPSVLVVSALLRRAHRPCSLGEGMWQVLTKSAVGSSLWSMFVLAALRPTAHPFHFHTVQMHACVVVVHERSVKDARLIYVNVSTFFPTV